jgi:hypothetical protein
MQTWITQNPGFAYWLHDDADCRKFVRLNFPYLLHYYDNLLTPVERSDIWRYLVLHVHGGVYADIDVSCQKPVNAWDATFSHLSFSSNPQPPRLWVGMESYYDSYSRAVETKHYFPLQLTQWTIAALPGHPLLGSMGSRSMQETVKEFLLLMRHVAAVTPQPGQAAQRKEHKQQQEQKEQQEQHQRQKEEQQGSQQLQQHRRSMNSKAPQQRQQEQQATQQFIHSPQLGTTAFPKPYPTNAVLQMGKHAQQQRDFRDPSQGLQRQQEEQKPLQQRQLERSMAALGAAGLTEGAASSRQAVPQHQAVVQDIRQMGQQQGKQQEQLQGENVLTEGPGQEQLYLGPSFVQVGNSVSFDYQATILNRTGPFLWTEAVLEFLQSTYANSYRDHSNSSRRGRYVGLNEAEKISLQNANSEPPVGLIRATDAGAAAAAEWAQGRGFHVTHHQQQEQWEELQGEQEVHRGHLQQRHLSSNPPLAAAAASGQPMGDASASKAADLRAAGEVHASGSSSSHSAHVQTEAAPGDEEEAEAAAVAMLDVASLRGGAWVGDVKLLPIAAFAAGQSDSPDAPKEDAGVLVLHHFMGSWKKHLEKGWVQPAPVSMHQEESYGEDEEDVLQGEGSSDVRDDKGLMPSVQQGIEVTPALGVGATAFSAADASGENGAGGGKAERSSSTPTDGESSSPAAAAAATFRTGSAGSKAMADTTGLAEASHSSNLKRHARSRRMGGGLRDLHQQDEELLERVEHLEEEDAQQPCQQQGGAGAFGVETEHGTERQLLQGRQLQQQLHWPHAHAIRVGSDAGEGQREAHSNAAAAGGGGDQGQGSGASNTGGPTDGHPHHQYYQRGDPGGQGPGTRGGGGGAVGGAHTWHEMLQARPGGFHSTLGGGSGVGFALNPNTLGPNMQLLPLYVTQMGGGGVMPRGGPQVAPWWPGAGMVPGLPFKGTGVSGISMLQRLATLGGGRRAKRTCVWGVEWGDWLD